MLPASAPAAVLPHELVMLSLSAAAQLVIPLKTWGKITAARCSCFVTKAGGGSNSRIGLHCVTAGAGWEPRAAQSAAAPLTRDPQKARACCLEARRRRLQPRPQQLQLLRCAHPQGAAVLLLLLLQPTMMIMMMVREHLRPLVALGALLLWPWAMLLLRMLRRRQEPWMCMSPQHAQLLR